ncbi:MAG: hypothetical protein ACJ76H_09425 [Bacteriovoracaceae bacterium]
MKNPYHQDGTPITWIGAGWEINGNSKTYLNLYLNGFGAGNGTMDLVSSGQKVWEEDISPEALILKGFLNYLEDNRVKHSHPEIKIFEVSFSQDVKRESAVQFKEIEIEIGPNLIRTFSSVDEVIDYFKPKECKGKEDDSEINDSSRALIEEKGSSSRSEPLSSSSTTNQ